MFLRLRGAAAAAADPGGGGDERLETDLWPNGTVTAASASQADVQSAVNSAVDGQRVLIPDGTVTWSSGISTTKQILIRAQNYTPTEGGSSTQSVVITNNSSTPLISMVSNDTYHVGVAGIRFNEGTQQTNYLRFTGSGSKVPLVSDIYHQQNSRNGTALDVATVVMNSLGGVMWNFEVVGIGTNANGNGPALGSESLYIQSPRAWESNSTLGDQDTDGSVNVYFEDSSCFNVSNWPDCEDQGRFVARHCDFDGTHGTGHGFSGQWGSRSMEYYNNTFHVSDDNRAISGRYIWVRAGQCVTHDNVFNNADDPSEWGNVRPLDLGEVDEIPGAYLYDRQPGCSYQNGAYVSDPIYMYDDTGSRAYIWSVQDDWTSHVIGGRDVFPATSGGSNPGAKPGYASYTYPHPLRYTKV